MNEICIDANIVLSFLSPDEITEDQKTFLARLLAQPVTLWAPALLVFEVSAVLARKEKTSLISKEAFDTATDLLFKLPLLLIWNDKLIQKTREAHENGIKSFYDANYLACAMLKQVPLITDDKEFLTKSKKIYPSTFSLKQWIQS